MKNISDKLLKFCEFFFGMVGVVMIMIASYGVLARNVLQTPVPWTDEALKLMFVWCIFVGASLAFLKDELISLTLVEDGFREKGKKIPYGVIKAIQYIIAIVINGALFKQLLTIIGTQMKTGESTTVIQYPLWILNTGMLVGVTLIIAMGLLKLINCVRDMVKK